MAGRVPALPGFAKTAPAPLIDFEREFEHRKTLLRLIVAITGGLCKQLTGLAYPV
jgi:hypothetical protein